MSTTRFRRTATLAGAGVVILAVAANPVWAAGRASPSGAGSSREVATQDASSETWESVAPMQFAHGKHATVTLPSGNVMVVGGNNTAGVATARVEIYNPTTDRWRTTAPLHQARYNMAAVLLRDGRVLVAGGASRQYTGLAATEIFDPATQTWSRSGRMTQARAEFDGILLPSGKVLVAGGWNSPSTEFARKSAEIFDPATGAWTRTGDMIESRAGSELLSRLRDGRVLVAGGIDSSGGYRGIAGAEIYTPTKGVWTTTDDLSFPRAQTGAHVTLADGRVMVAGGTDGIQNTVASVDVFDAVSLIWSAATPMHVARQSQAVIVLLDGRVLVAGGCDSDTLMNLRSSEVYDPTSDTWTFVGSLPQRVCMPGAALLPDGRVLVAGGLQIPNQREGLRLAAIFTP